MIFRYKKKKEREQYNITATKETKEFDLKITLQGGGYYTMSIANYSELKTFLKQLEDENNTILSFQIDKKHQFFLFKDKIRYGRFRPEKIKISEWFTDIGGALGFIETLKLDKWKEISGLE